MLFMLEDVAVPYVFCASDPISIQQSRTIRNCERHCWQIELHQNPCYLSRVHADGFLPAQFIDVRGDEWPAVAREAANIFFDTERLAREHLNIDQVEVHRVCVRRK